MKTKNEILAEPEYVEFRITGLEVGKFYGAMELSLILGYKHDAVSKALYAARFGGRSFAALRGYTFGPKGAVITEQSDKCAKSDRSKIIEIESGPSEESEFEQISGLYAQMRISVKLFCETLHCHPNAATQAIYSAKRKGSIYATLRGYRFCYLDDFVVHD